MEKQRYLASIIPRDAFSQEKMAFVSGPRQVGKSTLARFLLEHEENYFLYDDENFRRAWAKSPEQALAMRSSGPIVLDEIHKDRKWKTRLKGIYDKHHSTLQIIVTGSARLEYFRRGGDSLLGRYFPYRLHPFSVAESTSPLQPDALLSRQDIHYPWNDLLTLGGFPEPVLKGNEAQANRWSRLRLDRLVYEDSRDILNITDVQAFRTLVELLPERVGSLFSTNAIREDVGKAYATIVNWIKVLDTLYFCFFIRPYAKKISRSLRAEPKMYLYDILRIPKDENSKRLENLAALHLLKMCHYWTDTAQGEFDLHFVRNKDKKEVDFLVVRDKRPWMLIECKTNEKEPARDLLFFANKLQPDYSIQLVNDKNFDRFYKSLGVRVMSYESFFAGTI